MAEPLSSPHSAQQALTRPLYWLHLSTWLALLPVMAALLLLLVPGTPDGYLPGDGYAIHFSRSYPQTNSGSWSHGWPWHYLERSEGRFDSTVLHDPAWLNAIAWWGTDEVRKWNYLALAGDAAVAIVITLIITSCLEWHRRRNSRFLQFSMAELGCAIGVIAALLCFWRSPADEWRDEAQGISATRAANHDFRGNYLGPHVLRKLVGAEYTRRWERVQYAQLYGCDFHDASNRITAFKHLRCVSIHNCRGVDVLAEWINSLPGFEALYVTTHDAQNEELDVLLQTGKVVILEVKSEAVTDAGFANVGVCRNLEHVDVRHAKISDQTLIQLGQSPKLQGVTLENVGAETQNVAISDVGIAQLSNARHLFRAGFSGTRITDVGIRSLSACKALCQLYLRETRVTGQGFDAWDAEIHLNVLDLSESAVTDEGLRAVARLRNLHDLRLWRTRVSDAGLAALPALHNLESLDLSETLITDAGLASLSGLASLQSLSLGKTNVTDAGVPQLEKMHSLVVLDLGETKITESAIGRLRAALQQCDVRFDPSDSELVDDSEMKVIDEER